MDEKDPNHAFDDYVYDLLTYQIFKYLIATVHYSGVQHRKQNTDFALMPSCFKFYEQKLLS